MPEKQSINGEPYYNISARLMHWMLGTLTTAALGMGGYITVYQINDARRFADLSQEMRDYNEVTRHKVAGLEATVALEREIFRASLLEILNAHEAISCHEIACERLNVFRQRLEKLEIKGSN